MSKRRETIEAPEGNSVAIGFHSHDVPKKCVVLKGMVLAMVQKSLESVAPEATQQLRRVEGLIQAMGGHMQVSAAIVGTIHDAPSSFTIPPNTLHAFLVTDGSVLEMELDEGATTRMIPERVVEDFHAFAEFLKSQLGNPRLH